MRKRPTVLLFDRPITPESLNELLTFPRQTFGDARMEEEEMASDCKSTVSLSRADASLRHRGHLAKAQARADEISSIFGERAPAPLSGERLFAYRRRLLDRFQHHSPEFKEINLATVRDRQVFAGIEQRIYADAAKAGATPAPLPNGQIREIVRTDPNTGLRIVEFHGSQSFIKQLGTSPRYVTRFITPNGTAR